MNPIECQNVWKKYLKGERIYSLRDAIPNLTKRLFSKPTNTNGELNPDEFCVLKDISFNLKRGEVLGIIGPNGAGKSTILKLLAGIIKPSKGSFHVNGRLSALIEITAGFHPDFTGRENVYFNGAILGMSKKEVDKKFEQIVDFSGVREFIDTPVTRYSSGMHARVGFAVAAHINPDIMLVDEVLSVGDMSFEAKCAQKMRELLMSGTTIILVSHNTNLVQNICNRVILIDHGGIIREGTPEDVIPYYQNIVFKQHEEDVINQVYHDEHKIRVTEETPVAISDVILYGSGEKKNHLHSDEELTIEIFYQTKTKIESPIFCCEIGRADGVVCCSTNSKDSQFQISEIEGNGKLNLNLGRLNLAPGIYHLSITVHDKEMIHAYTLRNRDIFRVEVDGLTLQTKAVFLPKVRWELNDLHVTPNTERVAKDK